MNQNTDDEHHWMDFSCPQCALLNPPVAEASQGTFSKPLYRYPRWAIEETNQGLCVKAYGKEGGSSSNPMVFDHQLADKPASLLRLGLEGTMWDHSQGLIKRGKARSAAFKAEYDRILVQGDLSDRERTIFVEAARQRHNVGPCDDRVEHDGLDLMSLYGSHRAGFTRV